jgi:hypothetical protein
VTIDPFICLRSGCLRLRLSGELGSSSWRLRSVRKSGARVALVAILLIGACTQENGPATGPESRPSTGSILVVGTWEELPKAAVGWYRPEGAFWIDGRLVVVAASTVQAWDPQTDAWTTIASIPQADDCEGCGYSQTTVWTDRELLLWGGGLMYLASDGSVHDGISVDLNGTITPLPEAPIRNRWWHDAIWTGSEIIVFGGGRDSYGRRDGAAFDPSSRTWRRIAHAPVSGYANSLIWTGKEMITWGGIKDSTTGTHGYPTGFIAVGAAYDPATDEWRMLEESPLDPRGWHSAVWTGEEMVVWGGVAQPNTTCSDCGYAENAGAYDPTSGHWRRIDSGPLPGRVEHSAVWTGDRMIIFGGGVPQGGGGRDDGAVYDPSTDSWELLPRPSIEGRERHAAVWTGEAMIVWGGHDEREFSDGASFSPNR